jgi:transposase-like protein
VGHVRGDIPGEDELDRHDLGQPLARDQVFRHLLSTTNAIESLNARFRKVTDARGHFPNEQAAMKALNLAVRFLAPKGTGQQRWITRWKPMLNVIAVSFHDRMPETANP